MGIVRVSKDRPKSPAGQSNNFSASTLRPLRLSIVAGKKRRSKSKSVIRCSINHLNFHAEGTEAEVIEQFMQFLDREMAPIRAVIRGALFGGPVSAGISGNEGRK